MFKKNIQEKLIFNGSMVNISKNMKIDKLNNITKRDITKGTTPTTLGFEILNSPTKDNIKFIKIEDIKNGVFKENNYIDLNCHNKLKRSQLEEDDILFSIAGTIGKTYKIKKEDLPANTNQAFAIIRLKDKSKVDFYKYYLDYIMESISKNTQGGVIKNFNLTDLKNVDILIFEDKDIEKNQTLLNKQKSLIDSYKEKLSLLEEQESYYQDELLSGRIRIKLNSENEKVAIDKGFIVNGELVEGKEKEFEKWLSVDFKSKVDFYKGNNKNWNHISNKKLFIKEKKSKIKVKEVTNTGEYPFFNCSETLSKTHNEYINDGEFLLFSTGGKAAVHYYNGKLSYSSDIYCVSINNKILPYYAYLYWNKNTDIIWKYFEGTGLKHLKKTLFEKEEVFYPENKIEQIFIISVFETVFKQKKLIEEKIKIEEEKMDYLMDELLSGRIRVE